MTIYWFIAIFALLLNRWLPSRTEKQYFWNLLISFFPLFVYGAIRVNYGNDYSTYEDFFEYFHVSGDFVADKEHHSEVGYQYLCYIMPSFRSMLILSAVLLYSSWVLFLYKNIPAKWVWLTIILIFLMPEKNVFGVLVGMRNGMVISGLLLTYTYIRMRKPFYVAAVTLLLSTIHTSAIAYIPLAYIVARNTPISKREYIIWIGLCISLAAASMTTLVNIIQIYFNIFADRYEEQLQEVIQEYSHGALNYLANIVLMIAFLIFGEKHSQELTPSQNSLLRMAALYCVAGCMGSINGRMTFYFGVFYAAGLTLLYSMRWQNNQMKMAVLAFSIIVSLYALNVWQSSPWWQHSVYHSLIGSF